MVPSCPLLLPGFEGILGPPTDACDEDISYQGFKGLGADEKSSKGLKCRVYLHHGGLPHFIPVLRLSFSPHHSIYPQPLMAHDSVHQ